MIGRYQEEMSKIHAPIKLIRQTKIKMKQEEVRLQAKKSDESKTIGSHKRQFAIGMSFAAAILLAVIIPSTMELSNQGTEVKKEYLAEKVEPELFKIENKKENFIGKNVLTITKETEIPEEFANSSKITADGYCYYLIQEETTGYYKACVQKGKTYYKVISKISEQEVFVEELEKQLILDL